MITHTRVRVHKEKVEEAPKGFKYWRYPKWRGWTDIRIVKIDPKRYDIDFTYQYGKKVSEIALKKRAILAFNLPFFWLGNIIGFVKDDEPVKTTGNPKQANWHEFYVDKQGKPHIVEEYGGDPARFVVQSSPRLIENGNIVVDEQIKTENVASDILPDNPRTAVGIDADGNVIVVVVDGRSKWDAGLDLKELAYVMQWAGCVDAMNADGGGSSTLYYQGKVQNAVKERVVHHAVYIKPRRYL